MSLPRYPEYKDSGVEWLGQVPAHWSIHRLGTLFRQVSAPGNADLPILTVSIHSGVSDEEFDEDEADRKVSRSEDRTKYKRVEPGDLVYNMMRAWQGGFGSVTVPGLVSPAYVVARPTRDFLTVFVEQQLRSPHAIEEMRRHSQGVTDFRLRLYWDSFKTLVVALPPLIEQSAIMAALDREITKIDALIVEQEKLLTLLAEKRQATISHAVTKGLNPGVPMKDSGVAWLGEVPAHWNVIRIKRAVVSIEQGWSPQCENQPVENHAEWGVLKVGCVNGGVFNEAENKRLPTELNPLANYALRKGDLLVSRANTRALVGSAAVVPRDFGRLLLCDKLYRLQVETGTCLPDFLAAFMGTREARSQIELDATGASNSMLNIGQAVILNLPLPLPPVTEQAAIMESIRTKTDCLDALTTEATRAIDLLKERRTALISAAVTGKIDVRQP